MIMAETTAGRGYGHGMNMDMGHEKGSPADRERASERTSAHNGDVCGLAA